MTGPEQEQHVEQLAREAWGDVYDELSESSRQRISHAVRLALADQARRDRDALEAVIGEYEGDDPDLLDALRVAKERIG